MSHLLTFCKGPKENEAIDHYIEAPSILKPRVETPPSLEIFVKRKLSGTMNENRISDAISTKVNDKYMTLHQRKQKKSIHKPKKNVSKLLTSKKRKELKLFELPKECEKYELYLPLHNLWKSYMQDLIEPHSDIPSLMVKADYHGAIIKVIQSKTPELVGIEGIVLQESMNTFKIITKENCYKGMINDNFQANVVV